MKRICHGAILAFVLSTPCASTAQTPTGSPMHPAAKRSQGFLDYALGKINPNDKDYGASAADARSEVVAYTLQNLYFWSNVVSLTLLAATSIALILVLRTQDKREIIAAMLISQLWNGRVVDRKEIVQRTAMYNAVVEAKNAALTIKPTVTPSEEATAIPAKPASDQKPFKRSGVQPKAAVSTSPSSAGETGGAGSGESGQEDLLLGNQIQALRNSERNLRTRLNQVSQDLERERQRNQTLKGA
ncbi:MAG: hypothetical protein KGK08_01695 [Acidobacteriota bacterium]|nr:hypothetical protein [Acidobacteriota bacterium]